MAAPAVRPERRDDQSAIRGLLIDAFAGSAEAALVDRLRADGDVGCALVAVAEQGPVGFILFCPLRLATAGSRAPRLVGLAPLAVARAWQGRGIGAALTRAGLAHCASLGDEGAVVLGDPLYYARFGFCAVLAAGLACRWSGPYFQAVALAPGALDGVTGTLTYPRAFDGL